MIKHGRLPMDKFVKMKMGKSVEEKISVSQKDTKDRAVTRVAPRYFNDGRGGA